MYILLLISYSTLLIKKRCAEAPTPKIINDESIMSAKSRSNNHDESAQPSNGDDKVNIAIPRRLVNLFVNICTQIGVSMTVYCFSPYLPSAQPKQPSLCSPPLKTITVAPKT